MPWKETCAMDQRAKFIFDVQQAKLSKAELCRRYGISRPTGDKWLQRYAQGGLPALADISRSSHRHPNEIPQELAEMIISLRRRHTRWGPKKLRILLQERYPKMVWPALSTIGEILRRAGLTVGRKPRRRTPPYTQPFAACGSPNDLWCADFKGWFRTGDGRRCDPLTITDSHSRRLLRTVGLTETKFGVVKPIFEAAFREFGLPLAMRTDNGPPFASRGIGGLSRLSVWWLRLGIQPERIAPGKPQQNGRHERMHRTLKAETANPPAKDLRRQQQCFDAFVHEFNHVRPHEALGQNKPGLVYTPSPREYREPAEVWYPDEMEVRSVKSNGVIHWRGDSVFLGEALGRQRVGLSEVADGCWVVYFCRQALGVVDQQRRKVYDLAVALRKGSISASAIRRPFRYAPGTPDGPETCKPCARIKT
jgi:putative transposase